MASLMVKYMTTKLPANDASASTIEQEIEAMINRKMARETRAYVEKVCGKGFARALIDERDEILTQAMKNVPAGSIVVGVVGLAHLDGIEKNWDRM